mmetsp:Transcript_21374/g.32937  ORF Transcript_21374/g.32937 Transcript_21374/m.32937 type:complete len:199 (-) Transcript_21374:1513-2109(-)
MYSCRSCGPETRILFCLSQGCHLRSRQTTSGKFRLGNQRHVSKLQYAQVHFLRPKTVFDAPPSAAPIASSTARNMTDTPMCAQMDTSPPPPPPSSHSICLSRALPFQTIEFLVCFDLCCVLSPDMNFILQKSIQITDKQKKQREIEKDNTSFLSPLILPLSLSLSLSLSIYLSISSHTWSVLQCNPTQLNSTLKMFSS